MKKVRLAIGAAIPAAGMLALPATTAHATTSAAKAPHVGAHRTVRPDAACNNVNHKSAISANGLFAFSIHYGPGDCINRQRALLSRSQTGLTERVRFWNNGNPNVMLKSKKIGGTIHSFSNSTTWQSSPRQRPGARDSATRQSPEAYLGHASGDDTPGGQPQPRRVVGSAVGIRVIRAQTRCQGSAATGRPAGGYRGGAGTCRRTPGCRRVRR